MNQRAQRSQRIDILSASSALSAANRYVRHISSHHPHRSPGGDNGFREALSRLSDEILRRAAIVYIRVSYEESLRRHRRRARAGQEDSILSRR
jgi:hypothetical protein